MKTQNHSEATDQSLLKLLLLLLLLLEGEEEKGERERELEAKKKRREFSWLFINKRFINYRPLPLIQLPAAIATSHDARQEAEHQSW